jgi:phospholipase A-2-activating protein
VDTLSGHTSFVYAIAVLPSGDLVSAGEDRTVRVWHGEFSTMPPTVNLCSIFVIDFENTQTILHPAISVWAVSTMPNGDIVTGCSDGVVRIFSEAEERWVSADELKAYDELIANQERPQHEVANVKTSDPSVLTRPGTPCGAHGPVYTAHRARQVRNMVKL